MRLYKTFKTEQRLTDYIMAKSVKSSTVEDEVIMNKIYVVRGQKVMIDRDLAELYQVETKVLKQAVRRNARRFPNDFMFEMTAKEFENWRSQNVTSKEDLQGLAKYFQMYSF